MDYTAISTDCSFGTVFGDSLRHLWKAIRRLWPGYLAIFATSAVISWIITTAISIAAGDSIDVMTSIRIANAIDGILAGTIGLVCSVATVVAVREFEFGREPTCLETFKLAFAKWPISFAATIAIAIVTGFLFCLCIIPGIIFATYFTFALMMVILGDATITESFGMSKKLVTGHWWETFGIALVLTMFSALLCGPGAAIEFIGALPIGIAEGMEGSEHELTAAATVACYALDFVCTVFGDTLNSIAKMVVPVGITILYLRRASAEQQTIGRGDLVNGECAQ